MQESTVANHVNGVDGRDQNEPEKTQPPNHQELHPRKK
jgi:hypothetical protein